LVTLSDLKIQRKAWKDFYPNADRPRIFNELTNHQAPIHGFRTLFMNGGRGKQNPTL